MIDSVVLNFRNIPDRGISGNGPIFTGHETHPAADAFIFIEPYTGFFIVIQGTVLTGENAGGLRTVTAIRGDAGIISGADGHPVQGVTPSGLKRRRGIDKFFTCGVIKGQALGKIGAQGIFRP